MTATLRPVGSGSVARHRVAAQLLPLVVGAERLELPDGDRWLLLAIRADGEANDAGALAELLLRAEPAAHLRQVAGLAELVRRPEDVADFEQREGARDVVAHRAGFLARRRGALDAARGLDPRGVQVEADVGLVEVPLAGFGVLLGDGLNADGEAAGYFVCHTAFLATGDRRAPPRVVPCAECTRIVPEHPGCQRNPGHAHNGATHPGGVTWHVSPHSI